MIPTEHILKSPPVELTRSVTRSNGKVYSVRNDATQVRYDRSRGSSPPTLSILTHFQNSFQSYHEYES